MLAAVAQLIDANQQMQRQLDSAEERLKTQARQIESHAVEARTDALTQVANRRALDDELKRCVADLAAPRHADDGDAARRRSFQAVQRHARPPGRRRRAADRGPRRAAGGRRDRASWPATAARSSPSSSPAWPPPRRFRTASGPARRSAPCGVKRRRPRAARHRQRRRGRNPGRRHRKGSHRPGRRSPLRLEERRPQLRPPQRRPHQSPDQARAAGARRHQPAPASKLGDEWLFEAEVPTETLFREPIPHVASRPAFFDDLIRRLSQWRRGDSPLTVILIQVDGLPRIVSDHGPTASEVVLRVAAQLINAVMRDMDHVARLSEDTFALLLPGALLHDGVAIAERLRRGRRALPPAAEGRRELVHDQRRRGRSQRRRRPAAHPAAGPHRPRRRRQPRPQLRRRPRRPRRPGAGSRRGGRLNTSFPCACGNCPDLSRPRVFHWVWAAPNEPPNFLEKSFLCLTQMDQTSPSLPVGSVGRSVGRLVGNSTDSPTTD